MDDDIIKQAALRRQRRARKDEEDAVDSPLGDPAKDINMPSSISVNPRGVHTDLTSSMSRHQQSRRRPFAIRHSPNNVIRNAHVSLPFIDIKIHGVEARALINSCVISSIINRHLYQNIFSCEVPKGHQGVDHVRDIPVLIGEKLMNYHFMIRGDIPDMVIGLDFLSTYKCNVDFGNKTFTCGEDDQVTVKLVNDRDLPLRYRQNNNLAASV